MSKKQNNKQKNIGTRRNLHLHFFGLSGLLVAIVLGGFFMRLSGSEGNPSQEVNTEANIMHEVGEELEEELEEIIPLYSDFTEIPCVNKICIDECLDQGFTDKFCATKCQIQPSCVEDYKDLVASNFEFAAQSVNENGLSIDEELIELSFVGNYNKILLEDFDLFVSLDTYKQSLENKKDLFLDMNELKEYSTLSDYLSVAIGAYDIISIENKYSQRQELLGNLPLNSYEIRFAEGADVQRFKNDIAALGITDALIKPVPKMMTFADANDPYAFDQWYLRGYPGVNAFMARDLLPETIGKPVTIAIIDDGIAKHPDIVASNTTISGLHGTHVAGIAGAATNNATGIASVGQAYIDLRVYGGLTNRRDNLFQAVQEGATVINMSFGCDGTPGSVGEVAKQDRYDLCWNEEDAMIMKELEAQGILLIASAGNDGEAIDYITTPAAYPGVISVGAITKGGIRASFSQYGKKDTLGDGLDLYAPGVSILSTVPAGARLGNCIDTDRNGYVNCSGTSMATPLVSSAIGLLKAVKPTMTSDQILTVLQNTATPVSHDSVGTIDVCRAVADVLEKDDSVCDGSELGIIGGSGNSDPVLCGNGFMDTGEACDLGVSGDQCGAGLSCVACQCEAPFLIQSEHCDDGELSGDETDIDCGGSCGVCDIARLCDENNDCGSGYCDLSGASNGCLVDADCSDNLFCNGVETCSNGTCLVANSPSCAVDQVCNEQQDVCTDKCNNGIWDENETGVDCGGVCEIKCQGEQHCTVNEDCASGQCNFDDEKSDGVNIQPNSYPQGANQESNVIPGEYFIKIDDGQRTAMQAQYTQGFNVNAPDADEVILALSEKMIANSGTVTHQSTVDNAIITMTNQGILKDISPFFSNNAGNSVLMTRSDGMEMPLYNTYSVSVDPSIPEDEVLPWLEQMAGNGAQAYVEPQITYTTYQDAGDDGSADTTGGSTGGIGPIGVNDEFADEMRYLRKIEMDKAREAGAVGSKDVVIAVVDDGFARHDDQTDNVVDEYNAYSKNSDPYSGCTHGTHTAGTAAAVTDNEMGVPAVSTNVGLMIVTGSSTCRVLNRTPSGVRYAAENGADIVSMSFGGPAKSTTFENIFNSFPDVLFIAAAGNDYGEVVRYPCNYDNVYCVAASTCADQKARFSNYGSFVDITAPGTNILSTMPGQSYKPLQGTSMATPLVSSLAGLIMSYGKNKVETMTILEETADRMDNSPIFTSGKLGAGRINACRAMNAVGVACEALEGGGPCIGGNRGGGETGGSTGTGDGTGDSGGGGGGSSDGGSDDSGGSSDGGGSTDGGSSSGGSSSGGGSGSTGGSTGGDTGDGGSGGCSVAQNLNYEQQVQQGFIQEGKYFVQFDNEASSAVSSQFLTSFSIDSESEKQSVMQSLSTVVSSDSDSGKIYGAVLDLVDQGVLTSVDPVLDVGTITTMSAEEKEVLNTYVFSFDETKSGFSNDMVMATLSDLSSNLEPLPLYTTNNIPNDAQFGQMAYMKLIEADTARAAGLESGTENVLVAVVDDGFAQHPDVKGNVVSTYSATNKSSNAYNNCLHGTHTSGSVSAETGNGLGVASLSNNVDLMLVSTTSASGCGGLPGAYAGVFYAVQNGADVVSMSFGGPAYSQSRQQLINAYKDDVVFVAAAGNSDTECQMYPCSYDGVTCVAASTTSDTKASFSNYGKQVAFSAPGTQILSTVPGSSYSRLSGTSMAAPISSSLVALLLSHGVSDPVGVIQSTSDKMSGTLYDQGKLGSGRINVCRAMSYIGMPCGGYTQGPGKDPSEGDNDNDGIPDEKDPDDDNDNDPDERDPDDDGDDDPDLTDPDDDNDGIPDEEDAPEDEFDFGVCEPVVVGVPGCTIADACNYDENATINDGTCVPKDCENNCNGQETGPARVLTECSVDDQAGVWTSKCECKVTTTASFVNQSVNTPIQIFAGGAGVCKDKIEITPVCGDEVVEGTEECDDGNTVSGDGCNRVCNNEYRRCLNNACGWSSSSGGVVCEQNTQCEGIGGGDSDGGVTGGSDGDDGGDDDALPLQGYPVISSTSRIVDASQSIGSDVEMEIEVEYATYAPYYPSASLAVDILYPRGMLLEQFSETIEGSHELVAREYSDKAATLELTLAPSTLTLSDDDSEKRIARSTIRVSFDIIGGAYETSLVRTQVGCYELQLGSYEFAGKKTCTESTGIQDVVVVHDRTHTVNVSNGAQGVGEAGVIIRTPTPVPEPTPPEEDDGEEDEIEPLPEPVDPEPSPDPEDPEERGSAPDQGDGDAEGGTGDVDEPEHGSPIDDLIPVKPDIPPFYEIEPEHGSPEFEYIDEPGSCLWRGYEWESCFDGIDNDCDGLPDCMDDECSGSVSCGGASTFPVCGDGIVFQSTVVSDDIFEECDDGNTLSGDGCSDCRLDDGWSCTQEAPSVCEQISCASHAEVFETAATGGMCCPGLSSIQTQVSVHGIGSTLKQYTICFDEEIDEPVCRSRSSGDPEGWYLGIQEGVSTLASILPGECTGARINYYEKIEELIQTNEEYCRFDGEEFDAISFSDHVTTPQKRAIDSLLKACVVKGRGTGYDAFSPGSRVSRAEFIKVLAKVVGLEANIRFAPEGVEWTGSLPYADMSTSHRGSQYLAYADQQGRISPLISSQGGEAVFLPNKSLRVEELAKVLSRVSHGDKMTTLDILNSFPNSDYPSRAELAQLMVTKFMDEFEPILYLQGDNRIYYEELMKQLEGMKQEQQYQFIIRQIALLDQEEVKMGSIIGGTEFYPYWLAEYLKSLVYQR